MINVVCITMLVLILFLPTAIARTTLLELGTFGVVPELNSCGSTAWYIGECNDDSVECQQLKNAVFSDIILIGDDWKLFCEKTECVPIFDKCYDNYFGGPPSIQQWYDPWHKEYRDTDSCITEYAVTETVDENGCVIKTYTWYDGIKRQESGCANAGACCYKKEDFSLNWNYLPGDYENAGLKTITKGGSDYSLEWGCYQKIRVYHDNEFIGLVSNPDSAGFLVDMDNVRVYDDYNMELIPDTKYYMRIRYMRSKYTSQYVSCDYITNEVIWAERECISNDECDDDNPYTFTDVCIDYVCVNSNPIDCIVDDDCEYFENCTNYICTTKYEYLDDDKDKIINKDDKCPKEYGEGRDGCPTVIQKINEFFKFILKQLFWFL